MIQNCIEALHSRTKENCLVIHIQKSLWRKLQPLLKRNKKPYTSKQVKENALASSASKLLGGIDASMADAKMAVKVEHMTIILCIV